MVGIHRRLSSTINILVFLISLALADLFNLWCILGIDWNEQTLFEYLGPGTTMVFAGIRKKNEREQWLLTWKMPRHDVNDIFTFWRFEISETIYQKKLIISKLTWLQLIGFTLIITFVKLQHFNYLLIMLSNWSYINCIFWVYLQLINRFHWRISLLLKINI